MVVVVSGEEAVERFARELSGYLGGEAVLTLPLRQDLPWSDRPAQARQIGQRARAIHALAAGESKVVVTSARALLRCVPPPASTVFSPLVFEADAQLEGAVTYGNLPQTLTQMGYERLDRALEPGSFSIHGDTIDIFPSDAVHPARIELFGDNIDAIRRVVAATGQSIGNLERVEVYPARELALTEATVSRATRQLQAASGGQKLPANAAYHLELLRQGVLFAEAETYLPWLYADVSSPMAWLSARTLVVPIEPRSLFDDAARYHDEITLSAQSVKATLDGLYISPAELDFGNQQRLTLLSLVSVGASLDARIEVKHANTAGSEERLVANARSLLAGGFLTLLAIPDRRARESLKLALSDAHLPFTEQDSTLAKDLVNIVALDLPASLIIPTAQVALLSLADSSVRTAARRGRRRVDPTSLTFPYKPGDYVVHATHGIALFKRIIRQEVAGVERDYLQLEYAQGDKLFTPVEQIDRITRYVGPEGTAPRLTRLNTSDWSRATSKARKAARTLAFDLVDLYARRNAVQGFAYQPDNDLQQQMELQFPYEETPDQLAAIADVKADMQSSKPMDRLICGDVGFGKTEVALRAAFKAIQSGKQVMLLCPTTILAQQHFTTFFERFEPFGVNVAVLSRFRTSAQQAQTLKDFAAGKVDMLIGTHRLLSADVSPQDLGLIVIDEEQRFGVQHKEQLKNLREQVDVLTLSATPIPRTMQMAISGVRDMSLIDTPPASRTPIKVHVGEWDEDVVSAAIRREIERGGQVYYVSNRVKSIDDAVARVLAVAPEARIAVAHGQMSERDLEKVMERFAANEVDVLVATTIIESGLDNPHSNTLIIEDSQRLGLAQLYQLKGRVGRSHAQAYAYFLFPAMSALTETAIDRLTAIGEYQELGSGMRIALRDLEIRGAGSLMGAEQHGMLSAVGFDLFAAMLQEAVQAARAEKPAANQELRIDLPVHFYLPEEYIPAADERVIFYRRLAAVATVEDAQVVARQLLGAYGALPAPAQNMVDRALAKVYAAELGIHSIIVQRGKLQLEPLELSAKGRVFVEARKGIYLVKSLKLLYPLPEQGGIFPPLIELLEALTVDQLADEYEEI
jgi:transcription-repair coupling factor (superfamily II helicase)